MVPKDPIGENEKEGEKMASRIIVRTAKLQPSRATVLIPPAHSRICTDYPGIWAKLWNLWTAH